jgi:hypothetical protein
MFSLIKKRPKLKGEIYSIDSKRVNNYMGKKMQGGH